MQIRNSIHDMSAEFTAYRRVLHQNPQTAFEESFTSDFVSEKLSEWKISYERGLGKTGIVATITGGKGAGSKAIGLRADMDALDITEVKNKDWVSSISGKMHGCGHDGHTVMLLAVAKYLSENTDFLGTVHLIFQPAEEIGQGAHAMVADGLFERFPCDAIYALHNWPYHPLGTFSISPKETMAGVDKFALTITGRGGHASQPHLCIDPIIIGTQIVTALQSIISREINPLDPAVLSITNMNAGTGAFNVIPDHLTLSGTVRSYSSDIRAKIEKRIADISMQIAKQAGGSAELSYTNGVMPTINNPEHAAFCTKVARMVVGEDKILKNPRPSMGGEDFGVMLEHVSGAYIKIGQCVSNFPDHPCNQVLHNPSYDFNDDLIPIGVEYLVRLTEEFLKT